MCLPALAPIGVALGATTATSAAALGTVTVLAVVAAGATAFVAYDAQANAAQEQNRYREELRIAQNKQYEQTIEGVERDVGNQIDALTAQKIQQNDAIRRELYGVTNEARAAQGMARAQLASLGVEGNSAFMLHNQFESRLGLFDATAERNRSAVYRQLDMEAKSIYARGQSIINSGYPSPLPPSATVSIGTSIMNGINSGISIFGSLQPFASGYGQVGNAGTSTAGPMSQRGSAAYYNAQLQPWRF